MGRGCDVFHVNPAGCDVKMEAEGSCSTTVHVHYRHRGVARCNKNGQN